jgi:hypothetical protein
MLKANVAYNKIFLEQMLHRKKYLDQLLLGQMSFRASVVASQKD